MGLEVWEKSGWQKLPSTASPPAKASLGGDCSLSSPCPVRGLVPLHPSLPKTPLVGLWQELPPWGLARQWKTIRTEGQNQYLVRLRGDYRFFSHDIHVSCTSCFSGALETQVPPRPRVARLWLRNICTSQDVHVWSHSPTLIHLSGSRDMLAWRLLGKAGGSRTAGDAEGSDTGSFAGEYHMNMLPAPTSAFFLTAMWLHQDFNLLTFHSTPHICFL